MVGAINKAALANAKQNRGLSERKVILILAGYEVEGSYNWYWRLLCNTLPYAACWQWAGMDQEAAWNAAHEHWVKNAM